MKHPDQTPRLPTLGWEALPTLGADRHAARARIWRLIIAGAGFWMVFLGAAIVAWMN